MAHVKVPFPFDFHYFDIYDPKIKDNNKDPPVNSRFFLHLLRDSSTSASSAPR